MKKLLLLFILVFAPAYAVAQTCPYPANVDRGDAGDNLLVDYDHMGRLAVIDVMEGCLVTIPETPGSSPGSTLQVEAWNMTDPTDLTLVHNFGGTPNPFLAHGMIKKYEDGRTQLYTGQFPNTSFSLTDGGVLSSQPWSGSTPFFLYPHGGRYGFRPWWVYNPPGGDAYVRDQFNSYAVEHQWDHLGLTGVTGFPHVVGNLLIYASDQQNTGMAFYSLDTFPPSLITTFKPTLTEPDGGQHGLGGYWNAITGHYMVFSIRNEAAFGVDYGALAVVDYQDPSNPNLHCYVPYHEPYYWGQEDGFGPQYVGVQDDRVFVDDHEYRITDTGCELVRDYKIHELNQSASQYARPLGNMVAFGGYDSAGDPTNDQGLSIWVTNDNPDTTKPYVSYHIPRQGQTDYPVNLGVSVHIPETMRAETMTAGTNIQLRTVGGTPVPFQYEFTHTGMLQIIPLSDLTDNTEYVFEIGGVQDFAGNVMDTCIFAFSTGDTVTTASSGAGCALQPASPVIDPDPVDPEPPEEEVIPDPAGPLYFPNKSSELACAVDGTVWVTNIDNDSIAVLNSEDAIARYITFPFDKPTSVSESDHYMVVTYQFSDVVAFYEKDKSTPAFAVNTGYGTEPISSVSDGETVYVALYGSGEIVAIDTGTGMADVSPTARTIVQREKIGPTPRAMTLIENGNRLLVTRYISSSEKGEIYDIATSSLTLTRTIDINFVTIGNDPLNGSGVPNFLFDIVVNETESLAYITAIKQNVGPDALPDDDNTVRAMMATINLSTNLDLNSNPSNEDGHLDFDNNADPSGIAYSPDGEYRFVTMRGNDKLMILDEQGFITGQLLTGQAPQTMCTQTRNLYIKNLTGRTVTKIDIAEYMYNQSANPDSIEIATVVNEKMAADVLLGKQFFYSAAGPEISPENYISCASCHADGGTDGQTWNLAPMGEGMRNTPSLNGLSGIRFGPLHHSANFDEIQDFIYDIIIRNKGTGFVDGFDVNTNPMTTTTAGLSVELDAIAAYVNSLGAETVSKAAYKKRDGTLNLAAIRGKTVFETANCTSCHAGTAFKDGLTHNVGTITAASGNRLGGTLSAIKTPTLIGLLGSAPYFHDGSAATLLDVLKVGTHDEGLSAQDEADLIQYLLTIDKADYITDEETFTPEGS